MNLLAAKFEEWAHIWCQLITKSDLVIGIDFNNSLLASKGPIHFSIYYAKINTNYEVTFGDELTSNMSPFFKFCLEKLIGRRVQNLIS